MLETNKNINFRIWLQKQFTDRARKNPRYSLRAFAQMIQMDASTVSQILSGKRVASTKVIKAVCDRLSATPDVADGLLSAVKRSKSAAGATAEVPYHQVTADAFAVIADWYHYAILELTYVEGFKNDSRWIAKTLGIQPSEARVAIDRLLRLELLEEKDGTLFKTEVQITNGDDGFTAPALRELQRQVLKKALDAIDHCEPEEKDITSMTMTIDPSKLPEAKKRLKKFRRDLCAFLESGDERTRVYNLGLQLYPISKNTNLKGNK